MARLNEFYGLGRLVADPEYHGPSKKMPTTGYCRFTIAIDRINKESGADFFDCTAFGQTAEAISTYTGKGDTILINGSLNQDKYKDKDGNNRYAIKINVRSVQFIGKKKESKEEDEEEDEELPRKASANKNGDAIDDTDEEEDEEPKKPSKFRKR